jgi:hypothetical protein
VRRDRDDAWMTRQQVAEFIGMDPPVTLIGHPSAAQVPAERVVEGGPRVLEHVVMDQDDSHAVRVGRTGIMARRPKVEARDGGIPVAIRGPRCVGPRTQQGRNRVRIHLAGDISHLDDARMIAAMPDCGPVACTVDASFPDRLVRGDTTSG